VDVPTQHLLHIALQTKLQIGGVNDLLKIPNVEAGRISRWLTMRPHRHMRLYCADAADRRTKLACDFFGGHPLAEQFADLARRRASPSRPSGVRGVSTRPTRAQSRLPRTAGPSVRLARWPRAVRLTSRPAGTPAGHVV
jgi:hypothetical protein